MAGLRRTSAADGMFEGMLVNQYNEFKSGLRYPDGYEHDRANDPARRRILGAGIFVLDRDASFMAASVSLSRPSTMLTALPWARLPAERTWIEFENANVRDAMTEMGSPNLPVEGAASTIERSGFLMWVEDDTLVLDYVHSDRMKDGSKSADLCPVRGYFMLGESLAEMPSATYPVERRPMASGRLGRHLDLISADPAEAAASQDIRSRFLWLPHQDMRRARENIERMLGRERLIEIETRQADEMFRLFLMQVLPGLILLNCRNAVTLEDVQVSAKLNRSRLAKGRPPLVEHKIVRMGLSPRSRRDHSAGGAPHAPARGTRVIGHFKTRKTGIFWWSPHERAGYGAVTRTNILTR